MKRNLLTFVTGVLLLLIFGLLLITFQVRTTEVAVVTTFGKPTRQITQPRAFPHFKWPWPIQKVRKLDKRIQNFEEDRFEQTLTADDIPLLVKVYVGWRITEPAQFFPKFDGGSVNEAQEVLEGIVRDAKLATVGQHPFADFVSADKNTLKFAEIEAEILGRIQEQVKANQYGIEVSFLGIKKLGLPESVTQNVFEKMKSERQLVASKIQFEGEEQARNIRSSAESEATKAIAEAEATATRIRGEGDAAAAKHFSVFQKNPALAIFNLKIMALEEMLKEKTTLILDQNTAPLDLLHKNNLEQAPQPK